MRIPSPPFRGPATTPEPTPTSPPPACDGRGWRQGRSPRISWSWHPAIQRGLLPGTSGHGATSWVGVRDIAEAAARILTEPDLQGDQAGRSYILTGTHPLSFPEIATILGDELGRKVRYVHLPGPAMYAILRLSGLPHWQARGLVRQFVDVVRRGADQGRVHTFDLQGLLGREPRGIAEVVHTHRASFARHA